jgi:ATP-dependent helicase HrpA
VFPALTEADFRSAVEASRRHLPGLATKLMDHVGNILKVRQEILRRCGPITTPKIARPQTLSDLKQLGGAPGVNRPSNPWAEELVALLPPNFLATIPFAQLPHLPRYLKALLTRMDRAAMNPLKDQERARQLAPYLETLRKFEATPPTSPEARRQLEIFRWMVEEYRVSLFAQELGTAFPISPKRLDEQRQRLRT